MASQAELLVAGGDSHALVLVVPASALGPFPLARRLTLPASAPAAAPPGYGRPGDL
ncbi:MULTISPECIES: hypothetical protein [Streptomyces]|uniref:hypothetical protein n=1 Tax=Streptomyces TaxID=1883 RepID=UPI000B00795B|nr:hypothetical protein [Streptomyces durhamensis]